MWTLYIHLESANPVCCAPLRVKGLMWCLSHCNVLVALYAAPITKAMILEGECSVPYFKRFVMPREYNNKRWYAKM